MPKPEPALVSANGGKLTRGIISLLATIFLCLPSLIGGTVLFFNVALRRDMSNWEQIPSALVAFGLLLGGPLVSIAVVLGAITALTGAISSRVKLANLTLVGAATVATLALLLRFRA